MVQQLRSRVTDKGQVTIPKAIRDDLGLKSGDEVEFIKDKGFITLRRRFDAEAYRARIQKWVGFLKELEGTSSDDLVDEMRGPRLTPEDIEELSQDVPRRKRTNSK